MASPEATVTAEAIVEPELTTTAAPPYLIGETAYIDGLQITLNDMEVSRGRGSFTAASGYQFVILDVTLLNTTRSAIFLSAAQQMLLFDEHGNDYQEDRRATASTDLPTIDSVVPARGEVQGAVGYHVPQDVEGLMLRVSAANSTDSAIFDLMSVAIAGPLTSANVTPTADPFSLLEGEKVEEAYVPGQLVDLNGLLVSVDEVQVTLGNEIFRPSRGKQFVILSVTLTNTTDLAMLLAPEQQMELTDDSENVYRVDPRATSSSELGSLPSIIPVGGTVTGSAGYHVPLEATGLRLTLYDGAGTESISFDLTRVKAPSALAPTPTPGPGPVSTVEALPAGSEAAFSIGQTVDLQDLLVTVNEVQTIDESETFRPEPRHQFILLQVTFVNTSNREITLSSALQMTVRDARGQEIGVDAAGTAMAAADELTLDGTLAPGTTLVGWAGYQVPSSTTEAQWIFKDVWGNQRVAFDLPLTDTND